MCVEPTRDAPQRPQRTDRHYLSLVWLLLLTLPWTGCSGCRRDPKLKAKTDAEKAELRLPDFQAEDLQVLPRDETTALQTLKPGHWVSVQQRLKSNRTDFYGELQCRAGKASGAPTSLRQSSFGLQLCRAVSLPKGQAKTFELTYFAPDPEGQSIWLHSNLGLPLGGAVRSVESQPQPTIRLRPYQNHLVVLARRADAYGYLKTLPAIKPPSDGMYSEGILSDYVVSLIGPNQSTALPSWPLMWTTISHILWDDFDAAALNPDQQRSLLDWLHWGGQLVISGPDSLDSLQTGFLQAFLPALPAETREMTSSDVQRLEAAWSVGSEGPLQINPQAAPQVVRLRLQPGAEFIPGFGELVAERWVGRGRIVTTGFALTTRELVNWNAGFDNFFNACLLRRPPREFRYDIQTGASFSWVSGLEGLPAAMRAGAESVTAHELDRPRRLPAETLLNSRLRYFSRDAHWASDPRRRRSPSEYVAGYSYDPWGGVAGWNDLSDCSRAAHDALTEAAGINVPDRRFVLWTLGLYLLVLVPVNWALFRALGRVEWAWLAVPFVALGGTWFVVHMAQLDIGFVRSRSEIVVLETQPGYSRGHLTRYTGLYSSLSTEYALSFDNETALALPLAMDSPAPEQWRTSLKTVTLRRLDRPGEKMRLEDFLVNSASTGMVHSEQMYDLGGGIQWTESAGDLSRVENQTRHGLRQAGVLRRRGGDLQFGWIGDCPAEQSVRVSFRPIAEDSAWWEPWLASLPVGSDRADPLVSVPLLRLALDPGRLREGDVRLVGWLADELSGLEIRPQASQQSRRTLVVANVQYGLRAAPKSDRNAPPPPRTDEMDESDD